MSYKFQFTKCFIMLLFIGASPSSHAELKYSFVFHIHGDHSYSYLDGNKRKQADKVTYHKATRIAHNCKSCEVLIIWEKTKTLFNSAQAEFYQSGKLQKRIFYNREEQSKGIRLYQELSKNHNNPSENLRNFYFYFGHQIPEQRTLGYSDSMYELSFSIQKFVRKIKRFGIKKRKAFDGIILSTCNNGTTQIINQLSPYTEFVLASPETLHLSYFDISVLEELDSKEAKNSERLMRKLAKNSFEKLSKRVNTEVSIVLYETALTKDYIEGVILKHAQRQSQQTIRHEYIDCTELKCDGAYKVFRNRGVTVFYKAPKFGAHRSKCTHSGWCA